MAANNVGSETKLLDEKSLENDHYKIFCDDSSSVRREGKGELVFRDPEGNVCKISTIADEVGRWKQGEQPVNVPLTKTISPSEGKAKNQN